MKKPSALLFHIQHKGPLSCVNGTQPFGVSEKPNLSAIDCALPILMSSRADEYKNKL